MNVKSFLPHIVAIAVFFALMVVLFHPGILDGKVLNQHDILQWEGGAKDVLDHRESQDEEPFWTNSMFSGMPAYLVSTKYYGDVFLYVQQVMSLGISRPYSLLFLAFISFYIMLKSFRGSTHASIFGSIAYGCSTFLIIGLMAGHNSRIAAIAFLPLVVGGVKLVFDRNYGWGFLLTAIGLSLEIRVNHLQITYYLLLILVVLGVIQLIYSFRQKNYNIVKFQLPILLLAAALAIGANYGKLSTILEYSKYSTRGSNELDTSGSGMDKQYAFEFSNGIFEPMVLFIPNFYGGASNQELSKKSNLSKALKSNGVPSAQISNMLKSVPTYWGDQRLSAPYYAGAITVFLFVLSMFILKGPIKYWLLIVLGLGIVLSWGDNFKILNYFLFENLPGYDKFRSVTFTILLSLFALATGAALSLHEVFVNKKIQLKHLYYATLATAGTAILIALFSGMGSFRATIDTQLLEQGFPDWYIDAIRDDRMRLMRMDAIRSAFFIASAAFLIWLWTKEKVKSTYALIGILLLAAFDSISVAKRYLSEDSFAEDLKQAYFEPTPADLKILEETSPGERVLNMQNPFNESLTSYFHNSVGGYHGAKLGRYQDLIDRHIGNEINEAIGGLQQGDFQVFGSLGVLNMLNTKYLKYGSSADNVINNPFANGSAWFVDSLINVDSPLEEIKALEGLNTKTIAVIETDENNQVAVPNKRDTSATISLDQRSLNKLVYSSDSKTDQVAVFSEIYYPEGWTITIDGQKADIARVNYVLRAANIPAGKHELVFKFEMPNYSFKNKIMLGCNLFIVILGVVFILVFKPKVSDDPSI